MPVKRCFNQTNESNNAHAVSVSNVENVPIDVNMNEEGQNQSLNDDEQPNTSNNHGNDSNSLPKNKRLALRQCLVSRYVFFLWLNNGIELPKSTNASKITLPDQMKRNQKIKSHRFLNLTNCINRTENSLCLLRNILINYRPLPINTSFLTTF